MISWEEAFTGKREGDPSFPPSEMYVAKEKKAEPLPEPSMRPEDTTIPETPTIAEKPESDREYKKIVKKKSESELEYPPTLEILHNRLEDIWVKMCLESKQTPKTILVSGAMRGEGASFVSIHMALFLALAHNMKTLFIDTNVNAVKQNPFIPGVHEQMGLASFFTGAESLPALVLSTEYDNFFILSSGAVEVKDKNQHVIIEKGDIETIMDYCKDSFDAAIFAGQTITFSPIMLEFAKAVDATVLVCRYGFSRREVIREAINQLRENNVDLTGLVLNSRRYPVPQWFYRILK